MPVARIRDDRIEFVRVVRRQGGLSKSDHSRREPRRALRELLDPACCVAPVKQPPPIHQNQLEILAKLLIDQTPKPAAFDIANATTTNTACGYKELRKFLYIPGLLSKFGQQLLRLSLRIRRKNTQFKRSLIPDFGNTHQPDSDSRPIGTACLRTEVRLLRSGKIFQLYRSIRIR